MIIEISAALPFLAWVGVILSGAIIGLYFGCISALAFVNGWFIWAGIAAGVVGMSLLHATKIGLIIWT